MMQKHVVPIGTDCSTTHYLRSKKIRLSAFPFDWNVNPIQSAIKLIDNRFIDFLDERNLIFLPSTPRMLFQENGIDLKITDEWITPVICKKYKILFPHDFSVAGREDLVAVRKKYSRRAQRLLHLLDTTEKVYFLFDLGSLNTWQLSQFESAKLNFLGENEEELSYLFNRFKKKYPNVEFMSLSKFKLNRNRFGLPNKLADLNINWFKW